MNLTSFQLDKKIVDIIESVCPLNPGSYARIIELITFETYKKGDHLTQVGTFNNLEYFMLEGVCKSYLHNPEGDEITLSFFTAPCIISPHTTRVRDNKSILNLRALTELTIAHMDARQFEQLMVDHIDIRQFGNNVLQLELMTKVRKEIGLASLTGREKLQQLRTEFPNLENLVPHTDIASYLGITPISLSRLRSGK